MYLVSLASSESLEFPSLGWMTVFYEKVKNVKADVAAVLV
jgi:hypothetical protein